MGKSWILGERVTWRHSNRILNNYISHRFVVQICLNIHPPKKLIQSVTSSWLALTKGIVKSKFSLFQPEFARLVSHPWSFPITWPSFQWFFWVWFLYPELSWSKNILRKISQFQSTNHLTTGRSQPFESRARQNGSSPQFVGVNNLKKNLNETTRELNSFDALTPNCFSILYFRIWK